jgi:hypothetical protein
MAKRVDGCGCYDMPSFYSVTWHALSIRMRRALDHNGPEIPANGVLTRVGC